MSQIEGAEVLAFTDPMKALEHFNLNYREYAVLISDCRMPGMSGIEFLTKVKEIGPSVPRILICVYDYGGNLFNKYDCVDKFLLKPISAPDLIREVKESIRLSKTKDLKNKNSVNIFTLMTFKILKELKKLTGQVSK